MTSQKYIKQILRRIQATDKIKKRIQSDLETELQCLEEEGLSMEDILRQKGTAKEVAAEFNRSFSDPKIRREYILQQVWKTAAILLILASVLVFAVNLSSHLPLENHSVAIIGGADGPTNIYVTHSIPIDPFQAGNLMGGILLAAGAVFLLLWIVQKRKGR